MTHKDKYRLGYLEWGFRAGFIKCKPHPILGNELQELNALKAKYPRADYKDLAEQVRTGKLKFFEE
jgi:hypothetical protein